MILSKGGYMVNEMIKFEEGLMSEVEEIQFFSQLIKTKMCWSLQGFYGRTAASYIQSGIISEKGKILVDLNNIF